MEKETFKIFFDKAPEAMIAVRESHLLAANEEARRMLGVRPGQDLEGRRLEEVIPMDLGSRTGLHSSLGRLAPGDIRSFDWEVILPGPLYVPVRIRAAGLPGGVVVLSIRDSTESRDRDKALSESEEQRRALVEAAPCPLICIDRDYRILWANSTAARLLGERPHSLVGRLCYRLLAMRDSFCQGCPAALSMRTRVPATSGIVEGDMAWKASAAALRSADGTAVGAVVFITDHPGLESRGEAPSSRPSGRSGAKPDGGQDGGSIDTAPSGKAVEAGNGGPPAPLDVVECLRKASGDLKTTLGRGLEILHGDGVFSVSATPDQIVAAIRRLAEADFGSCLDPEGGITLRVDPAEVSSLPGGLPPGRYTAISLGNSRVLEAVEPGDLMEGVFNFISSFPMGGGTRQAAPSGGVYVSQDSSRRKFYQILLAALSRGGV